MRDCWRLPTIPWSCTTTNSTTAGGRNTLLGGKPLKQFVHLALALPNGNGTRPEFTDARRLDGIGGCDTLDYQALKKALQKLGGSLSFNLDVQDFTVTLEGPEEALPELLTLLNQKMSLPTLSEKERTAVINSRKSERERYIKGPPQVIIITGNRKKIDLAAIEKLYGPVVEHKFKDIYRE